MKNLTKNLKKYSLFVGVFALSLGVSSCSDDDDGQVVIPDPDDDETGSFTANDQTLSGNVLLLDNVTVGQDSWVVVENADGTEAAEPFWIDEGSQQNVRIPLNSTATLSGTTEGDDFDVSLYADDNDDGTQEEFDSEDDLIENSSKTITATGPSLEAEEGQEITDNSVTFSSVRTAGNSWIVLYDENDEIIGRGPADATTTENVTVPFNEGYEYTGGTITPSLHLDAEPVGTFDYEVGGENNLDVQETYGFGDDGVATPYMGTDFTPVNSATGGEGAGTDTGAGV